MRSVDRNVVPVLTFFPPLPCVRVMEGTRCVARFGLQKCVSACLRYVSFLTMASRVSGCYSWPGRDWCVFIDIDLGNTRQALW